MNPRIEKLCLPRHRREAVWKFWQPNAKLEKIHPPIYWKPLDVPQINPKKKPINKQSTNKRSCPDGCHYTTLTGKDFRVFIDFEHDGLQHATWKEAIQRENPPVEPKPSPVESPWLNFNNQQQSLNDRYLIRQELHRYFKSHLPQDNLFQLDTHAYPNRSKPISRRPRDALHIDFYQADHLKGSKVEATFKTFYHRKYLLPRHLREETMKDLLSIATNAQLDIEIVGHFILHPNELSRHEIQMFGLTSVFGDIYEGHIIRINKNKLVLLLASAHHSHIKLSRAENLANIPDEPKSKIEEIILNHARTYLQTHTDHSIEQIRRIRIELESLTNPDKRRVIIHLLAEDEIIHTETLEITSEQEPKLFQKEFENEFYFLQGNDEQTMIRLVEEKLKRLFEKRYSLIRQEENSYLQLTTEMEHETINSIEKMLGLYVNQRLSRYSREECMRIAIEYSFDDLLDRLDSNDLQLNKEKEEMKMIIDDIRMRLRSQIERRLRAETIAQILLVGPAMKKEIVSTGKEVIVLDHHREIFINPSNVYLGPPRVKDMRRNQTQLTFHEEVDGGPQSFDRLPMSTDSLTILTRIQQRKRLAVEQEDNQFVELGSGIRRLVTSKDQQGNSSFVIECDQERIEKKASLNLSLDEEDDHLKRTTSIDTKSYNTSAHTKQKNLKKFDVRRKNKRISRSPAEYGKNRQNRKRYKRYQSISKSLGDSIDPKCSFFKNLFLLRQNEKQKVKIFIKNRNRTSKHVNANAIREDSNTSVDLNINVDEKVVSDESVTILNEKNRLRQQDKKHPMPEQLSHDEGFQDKEEIDEDDSLDESEKNYDKERYLHSLYGSLSTIMEHVQDMYQSKSSQLMATLDLAHILIAFLHLRKDIAYETASTIIAARQRLMQPLSTDESSSSNIVDDSVESKMRMSDDDSDRSVSSGVSTSDESDTLISEYDRTSRSINDDSGHKDRNHFPMITSTKNYRFYTNKNIYSSNSQRIMNRITSYLSEVDWRVYNYITKHFLQNGGMITSHALEFSSALLIDLIEDGVYRTYFHLIWCSDSCVNSNQEKINAYTKETLLEQFFKNSIDNLLHHLQLINLPLLESIALMHTFKTYIITDVIQEFHSMEHHPVPIGRDPCVWFSTDILIKTICSFTDDILNKMNDDYLSDYTKLEYLLISYFRKIEIVQNLQDTIEKKQSESTSTASPAISHNRCLLHVIDLNQAPKFFSDQAFKRFKLGEKSYLNGNIEALKDLVLLDIQKRNIKSVKRPYLPLSMDDLVLHHQHRMITPSPWILAQYHRRWEAQKTRLDKLNTRKDSYQFDESTDSTKINNLPVDVRALLYDMIKNYGAIEGNLPGQATPDQYEGLSEEDVAQMIANAIEAVEKFDRENNIGDRKLQSKKTVNDRLTEFFKYAGRHGVRLLDEVLKMAKLRSNDPKKYLPLAVNMLKDRLKLSSATRTRKQGVRFAHTLETLFTATNDEPELITALLKKKGKEKSRQFATTESDSLRTTKDDVHQNTDISSIKSTTDINIPSYPRRVSSTDNYRQTMPIIDGVDRPTIPTNKTTETSDEFYPETVLSNSIISQIGLTVAQMIVLATVQNQKPLKLTSTQIKQMCMKQDDSEEQWQVYVEKLMQTTKLPNKFLLTEEQLVQIAMEDDISIAQVERIGASQSHFQLNESQIRSLMAQMNTVNCTLSSSTPLLLHVDQFIDLCNQLKIDIDKLLNTRALPQNSSLIDSSKFTLTPAQLAYLMNQAKHDIRTLRTIEQNSKKDILKAQQFRLSSSQLACLLANRRIIYDENITGLSTAQLIAIHVLQQQSIKDEQTPSFSLTYQQIKQLALSQNMTTTHFQSLSGSDKPFQLTDDQLIYIAAENKVAAQQILSVPVGRKSKMLDRQQLCSLINQYNHRIQQRVCLNVEQIFILAKYSDIKLHQLATCTEEHTTMKEFSFKPEQLATLWSTSTSFDDPQHLMSLSQSSIQFTLSDEQFRSLLHTVSPSALLTHSPSATTMKPRVDLISPSVPSSSLQLIESNESIPVPQVPSTDRQNQLPSTLTNQLTAMHERLKSSVQAHVETMNIVSNAMLKRNHIESTLNLVHQLSLHTIDDISNKEVETIPLFALDLLKIKPVTENMYQSIKQGQITSDVLDKSADVSKKSKEITDLITTRGITKTIIDEIQADQLSFSQIQQIQTQLLTPKLIEEFQSGHLSTHVLDAYKSLSPLQIINKVRSSITQLNTLLLQQTPIISQPDAMMISIIQQTATNNPITTDEILNTGISSIEKQLSSVGQVDILPQTIHQEPITIYPESAVIRQEILQELRDCLDTQRIELKKEYDIEPTKGKASIEQITNKLRTMEVMQDLESLIGRQVDEVDILNILEGHLNHLLVQVPVDTNKTNELFARNIQHRVNRTNERIQLVRLLQTHIETERLQRQMTLKEWTALVLEDIPKFEQLTGLHLTDDDLRIISMNRFVSLERSLTRSLTDSEYRHLLQTDSPLDHIEQELLKRSLTTEERIEQEELTFLPYQELLPGEISISPGKMIKSLEKQNIELTHSQLEQVLERRAELVDQYDILHWISPTIQHIEEELDRSLTIDEKKRLIRDDYSMIKPIKHAKYKDVKGKTEKILPITASLLELVEHTQDKNLLENIKHLETDLGRSLTKQELIMVAKGDIASLEKTLGKSLSEETIKSIYHDRFADLTNELNRDFTETEIRDILSGKFTGIEKALGRQLTSTERLTYKPVNIVDLTASQLTDTPSIDTTIEELEDVLQRRLTLPEIQHLTDHPANLPERNVSIDKLNVSERQSTDLLISNRLIKQPIRFALSEIEQATERSLNSNELERFAGLRFVQIEHDLGKPLNDLQRSNLLNGDKLTIESLINRKLSSEETGPHLVDLTEIERILNRSLSYDELLSLSGDRFDDIRRILQRSLTQEELIDLLNGNDQEIQKLIGEKLDQQKEIELKELPINRIKYFENILQRKLSPNELLRFAEDRFEPLLRLLSDVMKPEQILDLSSGHYDRMERFFNRILTSKEKYELGKSILQVHGKYSTRLDELEYIIQRRLSEGELRNFVGDEFQEIEKRLGKSLTEKQLRNILQSKDDSSLVSVEDLINRIKGKYENDRERTRRIVTRLIEKLDEEYREHEKESTMSRSLKSSSRVDSIQETPSNVEFHQTTNDLLEQLSHDVRKHAIVTSPSHSSEEIVENSSRISNDELKSEDQVSSDRTKTPASVSSSPSRDSEPIKAFESVTRTVAHIADEEHIEEMINVNDVFDKFQEKLPKTGNFVSSIESIAERFSSPVRKTTSNETASSSFHLPAIKSIEERTIIRESPLPETHPEDDAYLGWTLFKGADRPDLGLKEETPRTIHVKHQAQTYVVGIPEEYADEKSRTIANKIYQGGSIVYRSSRSRIIKEMGEFVCELLHFPIINDATHFIVPSRGYIDLIEPTTTYQSELIDVEDDELQMRDSPETLEWYEECLQRNVQVHAQIPTGYQPSILHCHTGRRTVITPGQRAEQRKASMDNTAHKPKLTPDSPQPNKQKGSPTFERFTQPILDTPSNEPPSTARTVTDLIMHTVTTSRKTDLLEALEELFSQENLDKYQMTETHWQDIFLILLNSYLRSHALNRKEIFKRLTDKLHQLRIEERRRSSDFYPSISVASSPVIQTPNSLNEIEFKETKQKQFDFGLRSPPDDTNNGRSSNKSNQGIIPATTVQTSIVLLSNNNPSTQSLSQTHSDAPISEVVSRDLPSTNSDHSRSNLNKASSSSIEQASENSSDTKLHLSMNTNAVTGHQCPSIPMKQRRYKIIVTHSDVLSDTSSSKYKTTAESIKLPSIASKNKSSQRKQSTTTGLTDNDSLQSSSTNKRIRSKIFSNLRYQ